MHKVGYPILILENPKYGGNIGMICRLIANFSLPPLRIIGSPREIEIQMDWMAYHSKQEIHAITYYPTAKECFSDLDLVVGTGMIHGGNRSPFLSLSSLPEILSQKKFGFVFGREDRGISKETLMYCEFMVDFNLPGYQKSMNLSHSVSYCLSAFHEYQLQNKSLEVNSNPRHRGRFYEYSRRIFQLLGMDKYHDRENLPVRRLKTILEKSNLTSGDIDFFYKIFTNFEKKLNSLKDQSREYEK